MQQDVSVEFLGEPVPDWKPPAPPAGVALRGEYCELASLDAALHAAPLFECYKNADQVWDYLPYGPFDTVDAYHDWVAQTVAAKDTLFYAIRNCETNHWEGVASYLRIAPQNGSIEVGHINYSPALQRTRAGTEAMYLMMRWAFETGYRRYEWKCNALNIPSRRAAQRLGFSFEGVFRQATISKGRNRDTAWFAVIDKEWPDLQGKFQQWLSPENFSNGVQKQSLAGFTTPLRCADDPVLSS